MADYISTLNGSEMDQALLDMAQHTSEAWAVGDRNGTPVSTADETFQNNSKYYASRGYSYMNSAIAAANRAEAAVPSGTAGAVFFDRAQILTETQAGQARTNIGAGSGNRNLIDNPFFTVNQMGFSSGTRASGEYVVDRWRVQGTSTAEYRITANGLRVDAYSITTDYATVLQRLSLQSLTGKVVTLSVQVGNSIYSASAEVPEITTDSTTIIRLQASNAVIAYLFGYPEGSYDYNYVVQLRAVQSYIPTYRSAKLEIGSSSTLSYDIMPDYGEELAKCQRYFYRAFPNSSASRPIGFGIAPLTSHCIVLVPTPISMRTVSLVSMNSSFNLYGNGSISSVTSMSITDTFKNGVLIDCVTSGLTANHIYGLTSSSLTSYIDFHAEL